MDLGQGISAAPQPKHPASRWAYRARCEWTGSGAGAGPELVAARTNGSEFCYCRAEKARDFLRLMAHCGSDASPVSWSGSRETYGEQSSVALAAWQWSARGFAGTCVRIFMRKVSKMGRGNSNWAGARSPHARLTRGDPARRLCERARGAKSPMFMLVSGDFCEAGSKCENPC